MTTNTGFHQIKSFEHFSCLESHFHLLHMPWRIVLHWREQDWRNRSLFHDFTSVNIVVISALHFLLSGDLDFVFLTGNLMCWLWNWEMKYYTLETFWISWIIMIIETCWNYLTWMWYKYIIFNTQTFNFTIFPLTKRNITIGKYCNKIYIFAKSMLYILIELKCIILATITSVIKYSLIATRPNLLQISTQSQLVYLTEARERNAVFHKRATGHMCWCVGECFTVLVWHRALKIVW